MTITPVTRAELAALFLRSLQVEEAGGEKEKNGTRSQFKDVEEHAWYAGDVKTAAEYGLVNGFPDGRFKPLAPVSRAELAVLAARALRFAGLDINVTPSEQEQLLSSYTDARGLPDWMRTDIARALKAGLIKGISSAVLDAASVTTRAQAAVLIKRLMEKLCWLML